MGKLQMFVYTGHSADASLLVNALRQNDIHYILERLHDDTWSVSYMNDTKCESCNRRVV